MGGEIFIWRIPGRLAQPYGKRGANGERAWRAARTKNRRSRGRGGLARIVARARARSRCLRSAKSRSRPRKTTGLLCLTKLGDARRPRRSPRPEEDISKSFY